MAFWGKMENTKRRRGPPRDTIPYICGRPAGLRVAGTLRHPCFAAPAATPYIYAYTTKRNLRPPLFLHSTPNTTRRRTLRSQKHSRDARGGGLAPSAANPEPRDLVPPSDTNRQVCAEYEQSQRCNSAQLQSLHEESPNRVQIEQLDGTKIADSPGH